MPTASERWWNATAEVKRPPDCPDCHLVGSRSLSSGISANPRSRLIYLRPTIGLTKAIYITRGFPLRIGPAPLFEGHVVVSHAVQGVIGPMAALNNLENLECSIFYRCYRIMS